MSVLTYDRQRVNAWTVMAERDPESEGDLMRQNTDEHSISGVGREVRL